MESEQNLPSAQLWIVFCPRRKCDYQRAVVLDRDLAAYLKRACFSCHRFGLDAKPFQQKSEPIT